MKRESVKSVELEAASASLRSEIDSRLQHMQDRLMTAIFGFVNGASSRMETLEDADVELRHKIQTLQSRIDALEKRPAPRKR